MTSIWCPWLGLLNSVDRLSRWFCCCRYGFRQLGNVIFGWKYGKYEWTNTLPKTNSSHLKMDVWKISFLLGWPIFRCYVSFREGTCFWHAPWNFPVFFSLAMACRKCVFCNLQIHSPIGFFYVRERSRPRQLASLKLTANAPENRPKPNKKGSYSNHPFLGANC